MKAVASPNSAPGHGAPFLVRLPPDQKEGVHRGVCVCVCVWSHLEERGLGVMGAKGKPRPGRAAGPGLPGAGGGAGWAGHPALHWGPVWRLGEGDGWAMDEGAWQATVHRVAQSWTRLKRLSMAQIYERT